MRKQLGEHIRQTPETKLEKQEAIVQLYLHKFPDFFARAVQIIGDPGADKVVGKVFIGLLNMEEERFNRIKNLEAFAARMVRNGALMELRRLRNHHISFVALDAERQLMSLQENSSNWKREVEEVLRLLQPRNYAQILCLHLQGYSHKEIQEWIYFPSDEACRTALSRAKARFISLYKQLYLKNEGPEDEPEGGGGGAPASGGPRSSGRRSNSLKKGDGVRKGSGRKDNTMEGDPNVLEWLRFLAGELPPQRHWELEEKRMQSSEWEDLLQGLAILLQDYGSTEAVMAYLERKTQQGWERLFRQVEKIGDIQAADQAKIKDNPEFSLLSLNVKIFPVMLNISDFHPNSGAREGSGEWYIFDYLVGFSSEVEVGNQKYLVKDLCRFIRRPAPGYLIQDNFRKLMAPFVRELAIELTSKSNEVIYVSRKEDQIDFRDYACLESNTFIKPKDGLRFEKVLELSREERENILQEVESVSLSVSMKKYKLDIVSHFMTDLADRLGFSVEREDYHLVTLDSGNDKYSLCRYELKNSQLNPPVLLSLNLDEATFKENLMAFLRESFFDLVLTIANHEELNCNQIICRLSTVPQQILLENDCLTLCFFRDKLH